MGFLGLGGGSPTLNLGTANTYMSALQSIAGGLGSQANQANNLYNTDSAQNQKALNAYSQYLQSDPATESYNAGQVANAEQGMLQGAAKSKAMLSQDLAQRGISPNSSIGAGALSSIDRGVAANDAAIKAQVGQNNIARHEQNLNTLANLWGGATNNAFGQANTLTGQQAGIDSNLLNAADQQALAQYQAQMQQQQGLNQLLGTVGSTAATIWG